MATVLAYLAAASFICSTVVARRLEVEVGSDSELRLVLEVGEDELVQDEVQDCLNFPSVRVQCQVELHPGACFSSEPGGEVQCWSATQPDGPPECGASLDSRCRFNHSDVAVSNEAIPLCTDLGVCETECEMMMHYWGACYVAPTNILEDLAPTERCHCAALADEVMIAAMHTQGHCLTERVGGRDLAFDGACRFPSSAATLGLQSCLDVPSFPGKCPMDNHPGACYKTDGSGWMCWSEDMWRTDNECVEVHGFEGACEYPSFGERLDVADVPLCWAQDACANCDPMDFWGGCFDEARTDTPCMCAPRADDDIVQALLSGRCVTEQVPGAIRAFSGVCKLPERPAEGAEEERPECQDVASFAGQCPITQYQGACYGATAEGWRCWTAESSMSVFECQVSPDASGTRGTFQGSCEYKAYGQRLDEEEIQSCADVSSTCVTECAPAQRTWGACFADLRTQAAGDADGNESASEQRCFCAARGDEGLIDDMLTRDSCSTRLIAGAGGATYSGVCRLPELHPNDPLVECLDIPEHGGRGCSVATAPGACYGMQGSPDEPWLCWTPERPLLTHYECQAFGYTDACRFAEHGDELPEEFLEDCSNLLDGGPRCSMCDAEIHSLACYQELGDANSTCFCAERGNETLRMSLLQHDCKTREVVDEASFTAYFGVCKLPLPPDPVYRCETLPTYRRHLGTVDCGMGGPEFNAACFSETQGVPWQCTTEEERTLHCTLTASARVDDEDDPDDQDPDGDDPEPEQFFDGACLFNGAEGWSDAIPHPSYDPNAGGRQDTGRRRSSDTRRRRSSAACRGAGAPPLSLAATLLVFLSRLTTAH